MRQGNVTYLRLILILLIMPLSLWYFNFMTVFHEFFPIKTLSFSSNINKQEQQMLLPMTSNFRESGFFGIDLMLLKKTLEKFSWVERVQLIRIWPWKIHAQIFKRIPVARYNDDLFLDKKGILFKSNAVFESKLLPKLMGDKKKARKLFNILKLVNLKLKKINLNVHTISYKMAELIEIKTQDQLLIKVKDSQLKKGLSRFVYWYQLFFKEKKTSLVSVDLRYNNGLAIGYKI